MKRVLILFGGRSAEHEVSVQSARNVVAALDREQYEPVLVGISRSGQWYHLTDEALLKTLPRVTDVLEKKLPQNADSIFLCHLSQKKLHRIGEVSVPIDIAFPVLHGPYGEDGTIQGLFEMMGLPYVGCGVLASSLAMDKDLFRKIAAVHHLPIVSSITLSHGENISYEAAVEQLESMNLFIKPACMGSSVGVQCAHNAQEFETAKAYAFEFGHKIVIEKALTRCRELECAVLGNHALQTTGVGEIRPRDEFYSYEAKYMDPNGAELICPAQVSSDILSRIKNLSVQAFKAIGGRGMARVDFFLSTEGDLYLNEINTIPGFTKISMYPQLWIQAGLSYPDLITSLLALAEEVFSEKKTINLDPGVLFEDANEPKTVKNVAVQ